MFAVHALGKLARLLQIWFRRLAPDQVAMRCIGDGTGNTGLQPVLDAIETFRRPPGIIIDKGLVALVDIRG
ncbi:hypothetical protein D3C80_2146640 [compost metagenome]